MILPILLCTNSDSEQAESLLDWMAILRNKQPSGHILLATHGCHEEVQIRLRVSAEIGFSHVDVLALPPSEPTPNSKAQSVNLFYQRVLQHGMRNYRGPFAILEPDVVPTSPDWLAKLEEAYAASPKLYLSSVLASPKGEKCVGRCGVYPRGAAMDIGTLFTSESLFEVAAGESLVSRCEKTRLIQVSPIISTDDLARIRPDAVVIHGDKHGHLLAKVRQEWGGVEDLTAVPPLTEEARSIADSNSLPVEPPPQLGTVKLDARTKAGRLAKLQAQKAS